MVTCLPALCLLALLQAETPPPEPPSTAAPSAAATGELATMARGPELAVTLTLEELRKGELILDAGSLDPYLAASVTVIESGFRISGSFAYLEGMRRMLERGGRVTNLELSNILPRVYGHAAVVTYRYDKAWVDNGARHREAGWCTDVLTQRDDGTWMLVTRQRSPGK